jgi:hypothetical protein
MTTSTRDVRRRFVSAARGGMAGDLAVLTLVGALIRLIPYLGTDFPLHDGGMFLKTIEDIRAHGMGLPDTLSYNGGLIPFDYPPLAFWVAAASPFDPITSLRLIPLVATILVVPAFSLLAREFLPERGHVFTATLIFALTPRSWDYLLTGGGLTRATGLLAAVLALWQLMRLYRTGRWRHVIGAGLAGGATGLLHPEAVVFLAVTSVLVALTKIRERRLVVQTAAGFLIGLAIVTPWLGYLVLAGRGGGLLAAGPLGVSSTATILSLMTMRIDDEIAFPVTLFLGAIGTLVLLRRRDLLVPVWLGVEILIAARGAPTYAAVPMAIAAGVGLHDGIVRDLLGRAPGSNGYRRAVGWVTVVALVWLTLNVPLARALRQSPFDVVTDGQRQAMQWAAAETPADARFVVVDGQNWAVDISAEWLPALADRVSLTTMQGYEWLGSEEWNARLDRITELQECVKADAGCVSGWLGRYVQGSDVFVYVPDLDGSSALMASVRSSADFRTVFDDGDALIARWLGPGTS